jgi:hypothetical protein
MATRRSITGPAAAVRHAAIIRAAVVNAASGAMIQGQGTTEALAQMGVSQAGLLGAIARLFVDEPKRDVGQVAARPSPQRWLELSDALIELSGTALRLAAVIEGPSWTLASPQAAAAFDRLEERVPETWSTQPAWPRLIAERAEHWQETLHWAMVAIGHGDSRTAREDLEELVRDTSQTALWLRVGLGRL